MASDNSGSSDFFKPLIIAVVVAIIGAGSGTWWWQLVHKGTDIQGPRMGDLEIGMNRDKGDFMPAREAADPVSCAAICLQLKDCLAMTYVAHPNVAGGVCWLKNTVPDATPGANMTSAVKVLGS